ncbi:hypothetical protein F511_24272 [Dorcoceras hygrometricum]|uniref:Uncharacterized protein n=1 Tax=Dorcoceras hygrometricum TaxID=472368 RepID=A0A2Z7DD89_9LAMI|nr:hypothetical protein F511_24272 [Dorcoceras hygrometricum]
MEIDLLKHHSVQPSYLKNLPKQIRTKAAQNRERYEVKPQFLVLTVYAEVVDRSVDIEESLLEAQTQVQTAGRTFQPVPKAMPSFQPPQNSQQPNRQRFKPVESSFREFG